MTEILMSKSFGLFTVLRILPWSLSMFGKWGNIIETNWFSVGIPSDQKKTFKLSRSLIFYNSRSTFASDYCITISYGIKDL